MYDLLAGFFEADIEDWIVLLIVLIDDLDAFAAHHGGESHVGKELCFACEVAFEFVDTANFGFKF